MGMDRSAAEIGNLLNNERPGRPCHAIAQAPQVFLRGVLLCQELGQPIEQHAIVRGPANRVMPSIVSHFLAIL